MKAIIKLIVVMSTLLVPFCVAEGMFFNELKKNNPGREVIIEALEAIQIFGAYPNCPTSIQETAQALETAMIKYGPRSKEWSNLLDYFDHIIHHPDFLKELDAIP